MKPFITILILIVLIGGIILLTKNNKNDELEVVYTTDDNQQTVPTGTPTQDGVDLSVQTGVTGGTVLPAPMIHTVTYTSAGFSPATLTIQDGDTVKFVNNSSGTMWVASDPHPQHTTYSVFDAKKGYAPGESYSFTFPSAGTFTYHDHLHSSMKGSVIVQ